MSAQAVRLVACPEGLQEALQAQGLAVAEEAEVVLLFADTVTAAEVEGLREGSGPVLPAVLVVAAAAGPAELEAAIAAGADAVAATHDPEELALRVRLLAQSRARFAEASPLLGLAGNNALHREIERRLPARGTLAVLAFDVDNFKGYNDRYGYQRGDDLLRHVGSVILQALHERAEPGWFAAHLGGDDLFALVHPREAEAVARRAIELFEAPLRDYYEAEDWERGCLGVRNRRGEVTQEPLASLTVAAVTNEAEDLQHAGQLAAVLAELKNYGKTLTGSSYVPDRRRVH